ncbi:MAG TPA: carboxypeptidase regulatory-like domain-containing protein [Steroidobacteraceae bacterium]|jgi:hypothetical protein
MDRPKHRRLVFLGLVLLAGGLLLLLHRQWVAAPPSPVATSDTAPGRQLVEAHPAKVELATTGAAASVTSALPSAASAAATGFRGRIIDAGTRQPVQEFEVQLIRVRQEAYTEDEPITRTFKSKTGRFTWSDVAAGTWRAAVTARGYQLFSLDEFRISDGEATREVIMPLRRGLTVRGRVFELSTGAGIADAGISFRKADGGYRSFRTAGTAKSQDDGSFVLDGVPAGEVILSVGATDHAYRELATVVNENTPPQEIALSAGATIGGTVTTIAGVPVKGPVILMGPGPSYQDETNAAGQFSYRHMPPGRYRVSADTSEGSASQEFVLHRDEIKEGIALIVGAGHRVSGVVRGLRPEQLQETQLMLQASDGAFLMARPDARGAYALRGVPAGFATMTVYSHGVQLHTSVDVPADQDVTSNVVFPAGARLSGRVTQDGKPAANRNISMNPSGHDVRLLYRATTTADGDYEIEGLPPGEYRFRADGDISRAITMLGDAVLNIDIPAVQLSARVLEDGGSVPIVGANVYVRGSAPETSRVGDDKQTNDFGEFSITGIEPGEIMLIVYKAGYELHREKIAYSSPITNRTITLRKSAGVEVRVQPGSRRFPRGFTLTQTFPGNDYAVDMWMPLDREAGLCHVPAALAGTTFQVGRFSGEPIVFEDWDGQSFDLP